MAQHKYARTARTNMVTNWYSWMEEKWKWGLTPGLGWHLFWHNKCFYAVYRHVSSDPVPNSNSFNGPQRDEYFIIYTLGRSQKAINKLLEEVHHVDDEKGATKIHVWSNGQYLLFQHKDKRSLDTIFIPDDQKSRIVNDIQKFLNDREFYRRTGKPYRRGYAFYGPPGTGKSSVIFALAGHFDADVYVVNPASVKSDDELQMALNSVEVGSFLLIEDIDAVDISNKRQTKKENKEKSKDEPTSPITLSGLLNGIDGVITRDGRILFITSNHIETLDEALLRPGRIDVSEKLDNMSITDAMNMFRAFYPNGDEDKFETYIAPQLPKSPAYVQNLLMTYEE